MTGGVPPAPALGPAERWADALAAWAIPPEVLEQAPEPPWGHPPLLFAVGPQPAEGAPGPSERAAREALGAGGDVLDVGCGGGRSSVALADVARSITGVDTEPAMLANFSAACDGARVAHREVLGRWPDVADRVPPADVVVCHHVVYDVAAIAAFLEALTSHARRAVIVELPDRHPASALAPLWRRFWQLDLPSEPSAELFVEVVRSRGWRPVVRHSSRPARKLGSDRAEYVAFVRRRLCLGAERDAEVDAALGDLASLRPTPLTTVSWAPPAR